MPEDGVGGGGSLGMTKKEENACTGGNVRGRI